MGFEPYHVVISSKDSVGWLNYSPLENRAKRRLIEMLWGLCVTVICPRGRNNTKINFGSFYIVCNMPFLLLINFHRITY